MRHYDTIYGIGEKNLDMASWASQWMMFDKIDGSNLRVEMNQKTGEFVKWGSRKKLLDPEDDANILTKAVKIFEDTYDQEALCAFLKKINSKHRFTLYFEFHGPNSFAGSHDLADDHVLTLLDIWQEGRGYLSAKVLYEAFPQYAPAYLGTVNEIDSELLRKIRMGELEGMGPEGVVFKHPTEGLSRNQTRLKAKRGAWIVKVQEKHQHDWQKFI